MVAPGPPAFVRLAAHPLRWDLLTVLARGDHRVRELVSLLGQPQNLVSYHLRLLREAGLVTATRSGFDGRDSYYHLDLDRCADAFAAAGARLHPVLRPAPSATAPGRRRISVLFVCSGNTARSPMAEALLRHRAGDLVEVASAGTRPGSQLHPEAGRVLRSDFGLDLSGHRPRHVDAVAGQRFDRVITVCDRAREACPEFPERAHWSIPVPSDARFHDTAAEIDTRVRHLLPVLAADLT
ncbi:arsenate reductase/protein-tyrosine-phosphatase family protein [Actinophytocola xanthii]|uniref:ArsR family transcriptional regulator n=1 Tax=Actinophytocola xanthii TaxID=1912961 RepID=A0A1Q8CPG2_9PSEU|nr:ArsR family transcriptional regulator [Actinophytocola xanthii]OLF16259.1 ArsR family transcriptional regulator [Actinophytocola xanthii]